MSKIIGPILRGKIKKNIVLGYAKSFEFAAFFKMILKNLIILKFEKFEKICQF